LIISSALEHEHSLRAFQPVVLLPFIYCQDISQALSLVSHFALGDVVLVKASRSEHFETLSQGIENSWKVTRMKELKGEDKK